MHFGQKAQRLFKVVNIRSKDEKYRTKKPKNLDTFILIRCQQHSSLQFQKYLLSKQPILQLESVRYQQRHNLLVYMTYIYSILSLECIIWRFSTVAIFGCFVSGKDFVAVFWSILLVIKAKQDQSGSSFLFNLLCE